MDSQNQGNSEHACVADQTHFQRRAALDRRRKRNETIGRKIHVPDALPRFAEHVWEVPLHPLAPPNEPLTVLSRQGGKQPIGYEVMPRQRFAFAAAVCFLLSAAARFRIFSCSARAASARSSVSRDTRPTSFSHVQHI